MRIGELLVEQRKLRQSELTRALSEKPSDKRLCSFLIARGLIDFDDASRALGEQKGFPCALAKHLAGRDEGAAKLIPAELGRASCALPIGRTSRGDLIVVVRDPAPALLSRLQQATKGQVMMVIAPANRLEHLVTAAYGAAPSDEFDIDFTSNIDDNPMNPPPLAEKLAPQRVTPVPFNTPPMPDMTALDPQSVRLALTDLDDARVDKDPTQSGQIPKMQHSGFTQPPVNTTSTQRPSQPDNRNTRPMSVGAMSVGLEHTQSREGATDLVLAYVATRWKAGLVLAIRDRSAIGYRGHGVSMPELISVPLVVPSVIQRAVETKFVSAEAPQSAAQEVLVRALNGTGSAAAAPVVVGGNPVAVIVVGDPIDPDTTVNQAASDLGMLADALGNAYQRLLR